MPSRNTMSSRTFLKRLETKATDFHLVAVLLEKKKRRKDVRTKIGKFVYIAADMQTSWKKVKRMCM